MLTGLAVSYVSSKLQHIPSAENPLTHRGGLPLADHEGLYYPVDQETVYDSDREDMMPDWWAEDSLGGDPLGRYANYFMVGHNVNEFIVDCGQSDLEGGAQRIHTRIVTAPHYAKALLSVLQQSIDEYEEQFGAID